MSLWSLLAALTPRLRLRADPRDCPAGTIVLLPRGSVTLACGIAAIVEIAGGPGRPSPGIEAAEGDLVALQEQGLANRPLAIDERFRGGFAGGEPLLDRLTEWARGLKRHGEFTRMSTDAGHRARVAKLGEQLRVWADGQDFLLQGAAQHLTDADLDLFSARVLRVRDIAWQVEREALQQSDEARDLAHTADAAISPKALVELRKVTAVLRSIDRIEVRGRDSAGIAVQVSWRDAKALGALRATLAASGLETEVERRAALPDLAAMAIAVSAAAPVLTFVYKVAAEVGRLGDNVAELRRQIRGDAVLRAALSAEGGRAVVLGHTRWASSGVISIPNCHPVDDGSQRPDGTPAHSAGRIFVVMNGDVDNHIELRERWERETGLSVSPRVTTDTKVVALEIERQLRAGHAVDEAFRRAVQQFQGSLALGVITDLAPGRIFLSLRGSGQSLYVGASDDSLFASSEVYGVVEEASRYVKLDGEKDRVPGEFATRGQIAVLASELSTDAHAALARTGFDGTPLPLAPQDRRTAEITTRDVDRGDFDHFFRKEITQATRSVERTLWGRVVLGADGRRALSPRILAESVRKRLASGAIQQVLFVGQGTAAVAGSGMADFLRRVGGNVALRAHALPATEMSGFHLRDDMSDTLVIAVTQSGSTADTNRAVDLARRRGALVVAVVNRRNSDITYRADGVVYTSDGRDVEMSVASTKAFYGQLTAGALLALAIAEVTGSVTPERVAAELDQLVDVPRLMQRVFDTEERIRWAAETFAPTRTHWTVVASGPNQVAGEEIRIKLSELSYRSMSVDTVENKKHIDLACEPLIVVFAAGNPEAVLNDIVKDVAIFKAHKAIPIVVAAEGETRFDPYAAAVIHVPAAPPQASVVLCALVGHLFGYHAARAIDDNARFFSGVRAQLVEALQDDRARGELPERLTAARREFLERLQRQRFTSALNPVTAVRIASLFDLATGVAVETPETGALLGRDPSESLDVIAAFVNTLGEALDECARPIDAIKHQAKIVTVGTSRPEEAMRGVVADALAAAGIDQDALAPVDLLDLRRIQPGVREVAGLTRYGVSELRADGTPGPETILRVVDRRGVAASMRSRAEQGAPLAGTKRQVVADRRLFLGVGRGDGRRIAILPMLGADRHVTGLVLLHLDFHATLPRAEKLEMLGPKLERVRDLVAEANRAFDPAMLDRLAPEQIVVESAQDLSERILGSS